MSATSAVPSASSAPAATALRSGVSVTVNPALSSCDCSWGATPAAQGSLSSTARVRVSGTEKSLCHVPVPVRK